MRRIGKISIITTLIILSTTTLCGCTSLDEYDAKVQQQINKNVEIQSLRLDVSKIKAIVDELKSTTVEEIQLYHLPRLEEQVNGLIEYYNEYDNSERNPSVAQTMNERVYDILKQLKILIQDIKDNNIINLDEKLEWIDQKINMCYDLVKKDV